MLSDTIIPGENGPESVDKVCLSLVWFYGIATIVGYLMPNPLHTCIFDIYNLNSFLNKPGILFLLSWTVSSIEIKQT